MTPSEECELRIIRELLFFDISDGGANQNEFLKEFNEIVGTQRKDKSWRGAIVVRKASDPVHYIDERTGIKYFDPSNEVYRAAYNANAVVQQVKNREWTNAETVGDVIEAVLGHCWDTRRRYGLVEGNAVLARQYRRSGVSLLESEKYWNTIVYNVFRQQFLVTLSC